MQSLQAHGWAACDDQGYRKAVCTRSRRSTASQPFTLSKRSHYQHSFVNNRQSMVPQPTRRDRFDQSVHPGTKASQMSFPLIQSQSRAESSFRPEDGRLIVESMTNNSEPRSAKVGGSWMSMAISMATQKANLQHFTCHCGWRLG